MKSDKYSALFSGYTSWRYLVLSSKLVDVVCWVGQIPSRGTDVTTLTSYTSCFNVSLRIWTWLYAVSLLIHWPYCLLSNPYIRWQQCLHRLDLSTEGKYGLNSLLNRRFKQELVGTWEMLKCGMNHWCHYYYDIFEHCWLEQQSHGCSGQEFLDLTNKHQRL